MGMFTEGYVQETVEKTIAIDENYSGLLGCFQIVSDAIHNEQVMFESLFTLDYTTALNEVMRADNPIRKIGDFIIKMIELVKEKIDSIITSVKEKFDAKKSKDLKDKARGINSGVFNLDNEKMQKLISKYSEDIFVRDVSIKNEFKQDINNNIESAKKIIYDISTDSKDNTKDLILKDWKKIEIDKYEKIFLYNTKENPELFVKYIKDPSYIIDNTNNELDYINSIIKTELDSLKKDIDKAILSSENNEKAASQLSLFKYLVDMNQQVAVSIIRDFTKYAANTYSKYLYSLVYLLHDKSIDEAVELEESVKYDVDMEFDFI